MTTVSLIDACYVVGIDPISRQIMRVRKTYPFPFQEVGQPMDLAHLMALWGWRHWESAAPDEAKADFHKQLAAWWHPLAEYTVQIARTGSVHNDTPLAAAVSNTYPVLLERLREHGLRVADDGMTIEWIA